jgi:hypothetical protein
MAFILDIYDQLGVILPESARALFTPMTPKTTLERCVEVGATMVETEMQFPKYWENVAVFKDIVVSHGGKERYPVFRFHEWDDGGLVPCDLNPGLVSKAYIDSLPAAPTLPVRFDDKIPADLQEEIKTRGAPIFHRNGIAQLIELGATEIFIEYSPSGWKSMRSDDESPHCFPVAVLDANGKEIKYTAWQNGMVKIKDAWVHTQIVNC